MNILCTSLWYYEVAIQGQIQDISCKKSRFYAKKKSFFPILGGGAPHLQLLFQVGKSTWFYPLLKGLGLLLMFLNFLHIDIWFFKNVSIFLF
jgi:hypothetical protein